MSMERFLCYGVLVAMFPGTVQGQSIIGLGDLPLIPGSTGTYLEHNPLNWGDPGNNMMWDYSSVSGGSMETYEIQVPSTISGGSLFPSADRTVMLGGYVHYKHYNDDSQGRFYHGYYVNGTYNCIYSDPERIYSYPMTMGSSWVDTMYSTCSIDTGQVAGPAITTASVIGWGSLTTPYGYYSDILLVERVQTNAQIDTSAQPYQFREQEFIATGYERPILAVGLLLQDHGSGWDYSGSYGYILNNISTGQSNAEEVVQVTISPNPILAQFMIALNVQAHGDHEIQLLTTTGVHVRTLFSGTLNKGPFTLNADLQELRSGMYLVVVRDNTGRTVARRIAKL